MGVLKNIKHEKFAQGIAKGMSQEAAYEAAGYKQHRGNASTLRTKQNVIDRIAELAQGASKRASKSLDDVVAQYERIAFLELGRMITFDEDGNPKYDLSKCTPEQISLMQVEENTRRIVRKKKQTDIEQPDIEQPGEDDVEVVTLTIRPPDRLKALDKLGSFLGMGDTKAAEATDSLAEAIMSMAAKGGNTAPMRKPKNPKK